MLMKKNIKLRLRKKQLKIAEIKFYNEEY